ncbi:MAG: Ni/Fe hydrogenase subunit alpha [Desulfobacteraceae bacterium]|nr:Ni/Fe hydrogenase subunit alpha [Desulfobacteraceae bacterium]
MAANGPTRIEIAPVTRIEGHAKITVRLDEEGRPADARLHLTQLRGFEKFCEGRPFYELPFIMQRICGICPVSHALASAKACDGILAVTIPEEGARLRKLANLAQVIQSHSLSIFYLSAPDLLLGMDAEPATRSLFGVAAADPQLARDGVLLRKLGQQVIALLAHTGKRVHPGWIVPGGVATPLTEKAREEILALQPEALAAIERSLAWLKRIMERFGPEIRAFANFPTLFMGIVGPNGELEYSNGWVRVVDATGKIVADRLDPARSPEYLSEAAEPWTYMKFPRFRKADGAEASSGGTPDGIVRVGPLARLNIVDQVDTPLAAQEWSEFRALERGVVLSSFHYHYARMIEVLHAIEKIGAMLTQPALDKRVQAKAEPNRNEGIGLAEAPRGMLIHHYKIDDQGLVIWVNLTIATGFNNWAINRGLLQAAKSFITGPEISDGTLNRLEAVVRAFDPCLSCASHAIGQMPMRVQLLGPDGMVIHEARRE